MPVPSSITDLSTTAANNFPQASDSCGVTLYQLPQNTSSIIKKQFSAGNDVAATSGVITLPSDYSTVKITGTSAAITGFADCFDGRTIVIRFDGVNTLTHSAIFDLPTGANITTASGDVAIFINISHGVWQCVSYDKAVLASTSAAIVAASNAATTYIDSSIDANKLKVKIGNFTRAMASASGPQVVTGIGFTPKIIRFVSGHDADVAASNGVSNNATDNCIYTRDSGTAGLSTNTSIFINQSAISAYQAAAVTAFSSDGFTLSWTKYGSPTGNMYVVYEVLG